MVKSSAISQGLVNFVDGEILPKMTGWQKWIVGSMAGIASKKANSFLDSVVQNPLVKALGIVDEEGMIDIDLLYEELSKQAQKSHAILSIPMIGDIKLNADDVESLYRHIMNAR